MITVPEGKTVVVAYIKEQETEIMGYIDGYIRGMDDAPYALVVEIDGGEIHFVDITSIKAS